MNERGELLLDEFEKLLTPRTRIVGLSHVSNALGTINPVKTLVTMAHRRGIPVLVDGAQAAPHIHPTCRIWIAIFTSERPQRFLQPTGIVSSTASASF